MRKYGIFNFHELSLNSFFRIKCTEDEDAISKAPEVTNKREPLKSPKTYFFESLQKRRQKALTKSQSACRFLADAGPNLIRRGSTIRSIFQLSLHVSKSQSFFPI